MALTLGLFVFALSVLFLIKFHIALGLGLLLTSLFFITYKKIVTINQDTKTVTVCSMLFFVTYNKKTHSFKEGRGKILLINSTNELFGIDRKSSTFFTYDVLYHLNGLGKVNVFTSTNASQADKTANFLASNLNLDLENKIIAR